MMSWYYAGYYTGLYEGQQKSAATIAQDKTEGRGGGGWSVVPSINCFLCFRCRTKRASQDEEGMRDRTWQCPIYLLRKIVFPFFQLNAQEKGAGYILDGREANEGRIQCRQAEGCTEYVKTSNTSNASCLCCLCICSMYGCSMFSANFLRQTRVLGLVPGFGGWYPKYRRCDGNISGLRGCGA